MNEGNVDRTWLYTAIAAVLAIYVAWDQGWFATGVARNSDPGSGTSEVAATANSSPAVSAVNSGGTIASRQGGATKAVPANVNPLSTWQRDQFKNIMARPLFVASRRPPPAIAAPAPPPAAAPTMPSSSDYTLVGVLGGGGRRIAIVQVQSTGTPVRVTEGDTLGEWKVAKISSATIELEHKMGKATLQLFADRAPGAPTGRPSLPPQAPRAATGGTSAGP